MHMTVENARNEGRGLLEHECLDLLKEYGIPVCRHKFVRNIDEALAAAGEIGYPSVLKIVSRDIMHKSDVGGVRTGITSDEDLHKQYDDIVSNVRKNAPDAKIEGMLLVEQLPEGVECIVGMTRDTQLGAALMFGLGGVLVELFEDVSLCLLPTDRAEIEDTIRCVKGYKLLTGYRGKPPCDIEAVVDLMLKVGRMTEENPEITEIDINPVFVYPCGAIPADVRILVN